MKLSVGIVYLSPLIELSFDVTCMVMSCTLTLDWSSDPS